MRLLDRFDDSHSRILLGFVISGLLLGPALASWLLALGQYLEERIIEQTLTEQVMQVASDPDGYTFAIHPLFPDMRLLGTFNLSRLPIAMLELPDGIHEFDGPLRNWHIALQSRDGLRYAVLQDTSALERRESLGVGMVVGGTFLAVALSLGLGFWVSNRILRPLQGLAERVRTDDGAGSFAQQFPRYEIGELARALDAYQARWQQALQREREFSADASHELRNPLAVVRSAAEVVENDPTLSARGRSTARRMLDAARQMEETVSSLLYLVRTNAEQRGFHHIDIASCIDLAIDALQLDPRHSQRIELCYQARPTLPAPEGAIRIIASNLIDNALKYSDPSPVRVTLLSDRLVVEDSGVGINPEDCESILALGTRGPDASGEGWGIGLSLATRLARRFDWQLHLESKPDEGTRATWQFTP